MKKQKTIYFLILVCILTSIGLLMASENGGSSYRLMSIASSIFAGISMYSLIRMYEIDKRDKDDN